MTQAAKAGKQRPLHDTQHQDADPLIAVKASQGSLVPLCPVASCPHQLSHSKFPCSETPTHVTGSGKPGSSIPGNRICIQDTYIPSGEAELLQAHLSEPARLAAMDYTLVALPCTLGRQPGSGGKRPFQAIDATGVSIDELDEPGDTSKSLKRATKHGLAMRPTLPPVLDTLLAEVSQVLNGAGCAL